MSRKTDHQSRLPVAGSVLSLPLLSLLFCLLGGAASNAPAAPNAAGLEMRSLESRSNTLVRPVHVGRLDLAQPTADVVCIYNFSSW